MNAWQRIFAFSLVEKKRFVRFVCSFFVLTISIECDGGQKITTNHGYTSVQINSRERQNDKQNNKTKDEKKSESFIRNDFVFSHFYFISFCVSFFLFSFRAIFPFDLRCFIWRHQCTIFYPLCFVCRLPNCIEMGAERLLLSFCSHAVVANVPIGGGDKRNC